jgi:outer membrane immunogenic protein
MKKFGLALTLAVLCALCAFTFAGPESLPSGKEMKEVVQPVPPPCPSWTGFYIGVFGGYKHADTDIDMNLDEFNQGPIDAADVEAHGEPDLSTDGAELGGVIGFNYQLHSNWVFGLEAAGGYLWLRDSEVSERFLGTESGDEYHVSSSFKTHYLFTVGPRIGYAFCRWMPYVTGGLAVGDLEFEQNIKRHTGGVLDGGFNEGGHETDTNLGWMVGGGMEYAITNHWKARLQYLYIDLGDVDFDHHSTEVDFSFDHSELELREHNASFALIYGF